MRVGGGKNVSDDVPAVLCESYQGLPRGRVLSAGAGIALSDGGPGSELEIATDPSAIDHGALGGLSDDDHAQYAKLTGRSGGQTLQGGTGADQHLVLESTSSVNKGLVRTAGDLLVGNQTLSDAQAGNDSLYVANNSGQGANSFRLDGFSDTLYIVARSGSGAGTGTRFAWRTGTAGAGEADRMFLDPSGNLLLRTSGAGSGAAGVLSLGNASPPSTSPADGVQLYADDVAGSSELKVRDEAGNTPTLSPHNFGPIQLDDPATDPYPWSYHHSNALIGVRQWVYMSRLARLVEQLTGQQLIWTEQMPPGQTLDWDEEQEAARVQVEAARAAAAAEQARREWVEVPKHDALEQVPELRPRPTGRIVPTGRRVLDPETGNVVPELGAEVAEVPTGRALWRVKAGHRLDPETGRVYRRKNADEVPVAPYRKKTPPGWMSGRLRRKGKVRGTT